MKLLLQDLDHNSIPLSITMVMSFRAWRSCNRTLIWNISGCSPLNCKTKSINEHYGMAYSTFSLKSNWDGFTQPQNKLLTASCMKCYQERGRQAKGRPRGVMLLNGAWRICNEGSCCCHLAFYKSNLSEVKVLQSGWIQTVPPHPCKGLVTIITNTAVLAAQGD